MTDHDFYHEYMQDIYARADSNSDFNEEIYLEEMCDFLVDQAVIESYDSCHYKKATQGIRVDAWNFNKDKHELSLFICDYSSLPELRTITQTEIETWFKRVEKFFNISLKNKYYDEIEESQPGYGVARDIYENSSEISKIKFFLLSNAIISSRFKGIDDRHIEGFKTVYDIWDISRRNRIHQSGKDKEDIEIIFSNFVDAGIPCLPASTGSSDCKSYLLVLPGQILAEVYDKYGDRLLEQNVRTFLQFRGGVNKGIRNTLQNDPEMFFAYNNGLTVTAEDINICNNHILSVKNMQIVNGGQTTASIFMSKLQDKKKIDLKKVYVQVKMSIISPEKVDEVVPVISKCANTQNKVSEADFFSNHPFHKRIEDLSRRILAPSLKGNMIETHWYYERARGQFTNMQVKMTPTQKKKFLLQNPKTQMFTKTDLAKYENSFSQLPHFVSKGAQWNFGKFAEIIGGKNDSVKGLWEKDNEAFNELYFKQLIAKSIIFRYLDKNIMNQDWYGGYKANIITYTISKLMHLIYIERKYINYLSIWSNQKISSVLQVQLIDLAQWINDKIIDTNLNVTQYCKQEKCWLNIKEDKSIILNKDLITELIDNEITLEQKIEAKKVQKVDNGIELQKRVFDKGAKYWEKLLKYSISKKLFTERDISILKIASRIPSKIPSEKQCRVIIELEKNGIKEGFFEKK